MKKILIIIYEFFYDFVRICVRESKYWITIRKRRLKLMVMNSRETIKYINKNKCSIARFGDGEFDMISGIRDLNFQKQSTELGRALEQVLLDDNSKILLCIPLAFTSIRGTNWHAAMYWNRWAIKEDNLTSIVALIDKVGKKEYRFGNAQITRPYIDWRKEDNANRIFPMLKELWTNRNLLTVEGEQTRLSVGNDLFENAASVRRIICPAVNAFDKYEDIKKEVLKNYRDNDLVLLALGPTATILASDLSKNNIQALDLGHIDIEYEWYLSKAKTKTKVKGKYVNEVVGGQVEESCEDEQYLREIVSKL